MMLLSSRGIRQLLAVPDHYGLTKVTLKNLLFIVGLTGILGLFIWGLKIKPSKSFGHPKKLRESTIKACPKQDEESVNELPIIYMITPTFTRPVQKADLTRLSHTLMLVPSLHWIIIEDAKTKTDLVSNLLQKSGLSYTHLNAETPTEWRLAPGEQRWTKPRGVVQRNAGLDWIRSKVDRSSEGTIFFGDDDNTYALEIFEEMRGLKRVGVWPVGFAGGLYVQRPKISEEGKVRGWLTGVMPNRTFAIDMAGFGLGLPLFFKKERYQFELDIGHGNQETFFISLFIDDYSQLEVRADNCTKVNVWHTRTESPRLQHEEEWSKRGTPPSYAGGIEF